MPCPRVSASVLLAATGVGPSLGCASIPAGKVAIDSVDIIGARQVDDQDIQERIATTRSPKFLGLFPGVVYDYELYDRLALQRDLARIERYYRARGFYEAHVRAGRVLPAREGHVKVEIVVDEGLPVRVRDVDLRGIAGLPRDVAAEVRQAARLDLGRGMPFEEDAFVEAENRVKHALVERGYAYAKVERAAVVDLVRHAADVVLQVSPGEPASFGKITLVGLGSLPEAPVRRALDIEEGEPYSASAIAAAQQAALDLGVFAAVEILPDLREPPPPSRQVPLTVRVQPSRLRTLRLGAGFELDALKTDLHLRAGWENRNFLGGLRRLSIDFTPGVVLYPVRVGTLEPPERLLPEEKLRAELRQPGFLEARTSAFVRPEINVFPALLKTEIDPADPVLGYLELRAAAGLDRAFGKLFSGFSYHVQLEKPFAYRGDLDPSLRPLLISHVELFTALDLRDDRVTPHRGLFVGNSLELAGGLLGGDAADVKVHPDVRGYMPLGPGATLAARVSVGMLFPSSYGESVEGARERASDSAARARDLQLVFFRGFFSGGPSSNRGYPLRAIGPHGIVPFLSPEIEAQQAARECVQGNPAYDPARCAIPLGGLSLWEASLELRADISGPVSGALFCDAGDVSKRRADVRLSHPHLSCGVGARYDTPVGPVRVDVGYRIPDLQFPRGSAELEAEPPLLLGLPLGVAFGIGEAF